MKSLLTRSMTRVLAIKEYEKRKFVLNAIQNNGNLPKLMKFNTFDKWDESSKRGNKISIVYRCIQTFNKKKFNKITNFSRFVFLKELRNGGINGITKSSW